MFPHHSDQMSQRSQVSRVALCMSKVKVLSVSESVSESVSQWQGRLLSCSGQLKTEALKNHALQSASKNIQKVWCRFIRYGQDQCISLSSKTLITIFLWNMFFYSKCKTLRTLFALWWAFAARRSRNDFVKWKSGLSRWTFDTNIVNARKYWIVNTQDIKGKGWSNGQGEIDGEYKTEKIICW